MKIQEVQLNGTDPKAKTAITGTITAIVGQEQTNFGLCQKVYCDGVLASFWPGKGLVLTEADCHKPMQLMCKARVYQDHLEYSLSRPFASGSGGGGRSGRSPADFQQERREKNRAVGLSYCLQWLNMSLPEAYPVALEIAAFVETGKIPVRPGQRQAQTLKQAVPYDASNVPDPHPSIQEGYGGQQVPTGDDIPF